MGTGAGRAVIAAAALGSGIAFLDGTVVNVALRSIGEDLDASLAQLQWITNGYLLSLASLILLGGSLGDRFGRRRVFVIGTIWFAAASLLCGLAPNAEVLIAARVLQGVGGALLTPGSLAMIEGAFVQEDRAPAIGAWSGLTGIAGRDRAVPRRRARAVRRLALDLPDQPADRRRHGVHRRSCGTRDPRPERVRALRHPWGGAGQRGPGRGDVRAHRMGRDPGLGGGRRSAVLAGVGFVVVENRTPEPMLVLGIFRDRTFSASNVMTLLVYGALGAQGFFVTIQLQTVSGYGALAAGAAFVPTTIVMLLLAVAGRPAGPADRAPDPDDGRTDGDRGGGAPDAADRCPTSPTCGTSCPGRSCSGSGSR